MKLTIERSALSELMTRGGHLAPRVNTIPILGHVRLVASASGTLAASTNDLDMQAEAVVGAAVEKAGATTVNARALADFVARLPGGASTVTIEHDALAAILTVKAGRPKARIPSLPVGDFPDLTVMKSGSLASFELTGADLDRLFGRTQIAISSEETRYYLNGVYLHVDKGELRGTATNGHILLRTGVPLPAGADSFPRGSGSHPGVIVPADTVRTALKLFGRETSVAVRVSAGGIEFEAGTTRIVSKLIDGSFPDCDRVIPLGNPHAIKLDRASCLTGLGLIEVFQGKDSGHAVECGEDEEGLAMAAGGSDGEGDGFAVAHADFEGTVPSFGVSSRYLKSVLGAFSADVVTLKLADAGAPILVEADADTAALGVIMPMRISHSRIARFGGAQ